MIRFRLGLDLSAVLHDTGAYKSKNIIGFLMIVQPSFDFKKKITTRWVGIQIKAHENFY